MSEAEHATSRSRRISTIRVDGEETFLLFLNRRGRRAPNPSVKGGANHHPRASVLKVSKTRYICKNRYQQKTAHLSGGGRGSPRNPRLCEDERMIFLANIVHWPSVRLMLGQRRRHKSNIISFSPGLLSYNERVFLLIAFC